MLVLNESDRLLDACKNFAFFALVASVSSGRKQPLDW